MHLILFIYNVSSNKAHGIIVNVVHYSYARGYVEINQP